MIYRFFLFLLFFSVKNDLVAMSQSIDNQLFTHKDSINEPFYPLSQEEESEIITDLRKLQDQMRPTDLFGGINRIGFAGLGAIGGAVRQVNFLRKLEKLKDRVAHYPEDDELAERIRDLHKKTYRHFLLGIYTFLISFSILGISLLRSGGGFGLTVFIVLILFLIFNSLIVGAVDFES